MAEPKPFSDWLYLIIVLLQLWGMLAMDLVQFYPKKWWEPASAPLHFLVGIKQNYATSSGDPFFAPDFHQPWFHALTCFEGIVQLPLALFMVYHLLSFRKMSGTAELASLVYGATVAMGSAACCLEIWHMSPTSTLTAEKKHKLFTGVYLPFLVAPAIMAIDMANRLLPRVGNAEEPKAKTQ